MDVEEKKQEFESTEINIGALLIEARENQNFSTQDIADQLNLTITVVEKIENNEFEQEIPLAFIRGYVRSYGQKVGVDIESLCSEFDRQTQKTEAPIQNIKRISPFGAKRREVNSNSPMIKIVTYLIVGALIAFGGWEVWKRVSPKFLTDKTEENAITLSNLEDSDKEQSSGNDILLNIGSDAENNDSEEPAEKSENEQVNSTSNDTSSENAQASNAGSSNSETSNSESSSSSGDSEQSAGELAEESTSNNAQQNETNDKVESSREATGSGNEQADNSTSEVLTGPVIEATFTFSEACWVQVTDANGEVLAIGTKQNGKVMPLRGVGPWNVILGEPSVVTMTKNGEAYDLSSYQAGRTAKFVLE